MIRVGERLETLAQSGSIFTNGLGLLYSQFTAQPFQILQLIFLSQNCDRPLIRSQKKNVAIYTFSVF